MNLVTAVEGAVSGDNCSVLPMSDGALVAEVVPELLVVETASCARDPGGLAAEKLAPIKH